MKFEIMLPLLISLICLGYYLYKTKKWIDVAFAVGIAAMLVTLFEVATKSIHF